MNDKFFDLKKEKQDRMINAALKIFAKSGYQKASTDDIVKEAGISKGLLFHYFSSKAGLYEFVYEFSARYMTMELQRAVSLRERDLFEILCQLEDARSVLLKNYPYMQKFLLTNKELTDDALTDHIGVYVDMMAHATDDVIARADLSRLEPDVDAAFLIKTLEYIVRGLMETALTDGIPAEVVHQETLAYYAMMKKRFSRVEYR